MSLINYEWKLLRSGYGFNVAIIVLAAAGFYGVWNGVSWSQFQEMAIDTALEEEIRTYSELRETAEQAAVDKAADSYAMNPGLVGLFYSRPAAMPPAALAATSIGQSDVYPYLFDVTAHRKDDFLHQEEMDNPNNLLLGRFDLAFVVVYLVPLFIIALTFNIVSGERERTTWPLLLSQPVSVYRLIGLKLLLRGSAVGGLLLLFLVAVLLLRGEGVSLSLLMVWSGSAALYILFWLILSFAVNVRKGSSAANGLILISCWIVWVFVIPACIQMAASTLHPVPPRSTLIEETRQVETEVRVDPAGLLEDWYEENPEMRPENFDPDMYNFPLFWMAIQEESARLLEPLASEYDRALESQYHFVNSARLLSPAVLMQDILNELAGSGYPRYRHFINQVDRFHREHIDYFKTRTYAHQQLRASEYDDLPRFEYEEEPVYRPVKRALAAAAGMAGWSLILFLAGLPFIRRLQSLE